MRRLPLLAGLALLLVLDAARARAQDLSSRTLVVPEANFSIEAPEVGGWHWSRGAGAAYVCQSSTPLEVFMVACEERAQDRPLGAEDADGVARVAMSGAASSGGHASDLLVAPSDAPRPGTYRFSFRAVRADGTSVSAFGYVFHVGRIRYLLVSTTPGTTEPPSGLAFVGSFRVLSEPGATNVAWGYALLALVIVGGVALVAVSIVKRGQEKQRGKPPVTRG